MTVFVFGQERKCQKGVKEEVFCASFLPPSSPSSVFNVMGPPLGIVGAKREIGSSALVLSLLSGKYC